MAYTWVFCNIWSLGMNSDNFFIYMFFNVWKKLQWCFKYNKNEISSLDFWDVSGEKMVHGENVIADLLLEFQEVFQNKLPCGLPLIRGNEHQISLILGAPLPNNVAYRCNLEVTR